jgi:hypothetical protein
VEAVMLWPLTLMIGGSLMSWAAVTLAGGSELNPELAIGMAGPLTSASATWVAVGRTHASSPAKVTGILIAGFFAKMVFFAALVGLVGALGLRPRPFVVCFAVYFIALHVVEAFYLRRLFAGAEPLAR